MTFTVIALATFVVIVAGIALIRRGAITPRITRTDQPGRQVPPSVISETPRIVDESSPDGRSVLEDRRV